MCSYLFSKVKEKKTDERFWVHKMYKLLSCMKLKKISENVYAMPSETFLIKKCYYFMIFYACVINQYSESIF